MKQVLQIKYCYGEKETNEFLSSLNLVKECPFLQSINYISEVRGTGTETEWADENGVTGNMDIGSKVIAVVQYVTEVE